jgi:hypothetical protein
MQKVIVVLMTAVLLSSQAVAGFRIDKSVYRMDKLESAQAKAKSEGKPMTFLYTDENTTCGLCSGASVNLMDTLRKKTVVVYADSSLDWAKLPGVVQEALRKPEAGKYIPKTVILDSELTKVITIVPYARGSEQDKLLKHAKKEISKAMPKSAPANKTATPLRAAPSVPTIQPDEDREMRTWKSKAGADVRASLVKETGRYLILKKEDGARLQILLNKLSDEDQKYVTELKEEAKQSVQPEDSPDSE